jgi:hypothetical protein
MGGPDPPVVIHLTYTPYSLLNLIEQHIHEGLGLFCHNSMFPSIKTFPYSCHGVSDTKQIAADAKNSKKMPNINAKAC